MCTRPDSRDTYFHTLFYPILIDSLISIGRACWFKITVYTEPTSPPSRRTIKANEVEHNYFQIPIFPLLLLPLLYSRKARIFSAPKLEKLVASHHLPEHWVPPLLSSEAGLKSLKISCHSRPQLYVQLYILCMYSCFHIPSVSNFSNVFYFFNRI